MSESTQMQLLHESIEDALAHVVDALGGPKQVGYELWGESKGLEEGGKHLRRCLNPDRPEKLALRELIHILRRGSEAGVHTGMSFLAAACLYEEPRPVTKEARVESMQRQLVQQMEALQGLMKQLGMESAR